MINLTVLKTRLQNGSLSKHEFIREALLLHRILFDYVEVVRTTDVKEIRITDDGVLFVITEDRIHLYCPPNEARVAPIEVMNFAHYEPEETRVIELIAADARNILDVGANIGWYSLRLAKRFPAARVFAFEPMPITYSYLERNIAVNGVEGQISAFNYGLSETSGSVEFFVSPSGGTNASLKNVADAKDAEPVVGLTLTLDQWVLNQGIAPDFIKCDVEGAELLVFKGGSATLAQHRPVVFTEMLRKWAKPFGYHPNDMINFFAGLGYFCFAVSTAGIRRLAVVNDDTVETNYAFLHAEAHAKLIANLGHLS